MTCSCLPILTLFQWTSTSGPSFLILCPGVSGPCETFVSQTACYRMAKACLLAFVPSNGMSLALPMSPFPRGTFFFGAERRSFIPLSLHQVGMGWDARVWGLLCFGSWCGDGLSVYCVLAVLRYRVCGRCVLVVYSFYLLPIYIKALLPSCLF